MSLQDDDAYAKHVSECVKQIIIKLSLLATGSGKTEWSNYKGLLGRSHEDSRKGQIEISSICNKKTIDKILIFF